MGNECKLIICENCGEQFTVERGPGRYPDTCGNPNRPGCERLNGHVAWNDLTPAQRRRHNQLRAQRRQRMREQRDLADLKLQPDDTIRRVGERSDVLHGVSRPELSAAIRKLAYAEGIDATYECLLEVAANASAWARRIRPDQADARDGKLMAA